MDALYPSRYFCSPGIFRVGIVLLVEAFGESQNERCPLIGRESESIDCDGFGGTHDRSLAYSSAFVRARPRTRVRRLRFPEKSAANSGTSLTRTCTKDENPNVR